MRLSVCLLTSSFDIGGAETHILTLAETLVRMGHKVTVVSSGGVYEKRAEGCFRHVRLPLNKKSRFLFCLFSLRRLFRRERFDVIHSHARFPSLLCKLLGVRFVSTAHWVFSNRFPLGALSFWGEGVLAVSEDIRSYLEKKHGMPAGDVLVTVNGIDTERFFADKKEDGPYRICHASRLDGDRSLVAFLLCEAVEKLLPRFAFSLTIVGGGEDFYKIKELADSVNARARRAVIEMAGATDAVEEYLASADIFVGVSRAALEGMAAECAVILAGNEGYLSSFSPRNAEEAESTNFCCRGARLASADALVHDLGAFLSLPKEALREQGKENRAYVKQKYSAERMAKDALTLYERAKKKKAVLCGYYGFGNVGDALMHRALSSRLHREGYTEILTLSSKRISLSSLYAIWQGYDLFLGGGNLLQDESSTRSLQFYLFLMRFALWRHASVSLLSSGIGPLSKKGEERVCPLLSRAEITEWRTGGDHAYAKSLGAKNAVKGSDAVLELPLGLAKAKGSYALLCFRKPKSKKEGKLLISFLSHLQSIYGKERLLFYAMHPNDRGYLKKLSSRFEIDFHRGDEDDFLKTLKNAFCVYANRLHAGVCALRVGVPAFLLRGDEKAERFAFDVSLRASSLSLPSPVSLFSLGEAPPPAPSLSPLCIFRVSEEMRKRGDSEEQKK